MIASPRAARLEPDLRTASPPCLEPEPHTVQRPLLRGLSLRIPF